MRNATLQRDIVKRVKKYTKKSEREHEGELQPAK
jgi:hypothetical protein